jgi:hypothetical protein
MSSIVAFCNAISSINPLSAKLKSESEPYLFASFFS